MNKFTKSILALGLALSIIVSVGGVSVFASGRATGSINGYSATGISSISYNSANASTTFTGAGKKSVTSTYVYVNNKTLAAGRLTKDCSTWHEAQVGFLAPSGCKSVIINSKHSVEVNYQRWAATTSITY